MEVVLRMYFLTLSNADIQFSEKELTWRSYIAKKALPTTQRVELINKKEFAKVALNENIEAFMVHVSFLNLGLKMTIYSDWEAHIALLLAEKITVSAEYLDFADIFSKKSAKVLLEHIRIDKHAFELENGKQPPYRRI